MADKQIKTAAVPAGSPEKTNPGGLGVFATSKYGGRRFGRCRSSGMDYYRYRYLFHCQYVQYSFDGQT